MRHRYSLLTAFLLAASSLGSARAQSLGPLDLEHAIAYGLSHHPALQSETAVEAVREAQVGVARSGYLPQLDLSLQLEAGTGNVLRGALFPMRGIPNVSGPPIGRSFSDASFGSLVGVGAGWDALGLIQRMAAVDAALADRAQAHAAVDSRRLLLAFAIADQFIDVLSRAEAVRAARATVERARVFSEIVKVLVDKELRPGVEHSRAAAELAIASTQLIRAEQAEAASRAELARTLGAAGQKIEIVPGKLAELPASRAETPPPAKNPLILEAEAAVAAAQARKHAVNLQYLPRLELVASLWVRGSGLGAGTFAASPASGLVPDTPNWAAGVVLSWPLLELVAVHVRSRAEAAQVSVADARRRDIEQTVCTQIDSARAIVDAARRVAENTPIALQAARAAEQQATARYRSGLSTVVEVAEAQRLLAQAEIDDAVARLGVRRARLLLARAIGDLEPFLLELREGGK